MMIGFLAVLLHVSLVSGGMQVCTDDGNTYSIVACGTPGVTGQLGLNGADGPKGDNGDPGLAGAAGSVGPDGYPGPQGSRGITGDLGPAGGPGPKGPPGQQGAPGLKGDQGTSPDLDPIRAQIAALIAQVQGLQSRLGEQRKVSDSFKKSARSGGKLYASNGVEANFNDALASCTNAGGKVVMPRSAPENDAILRLRNYYGVSAYLGINAFLAPGVFRYLTGETITYTNWSPAEPNNLLSELCVEMVSTGQWNNKPCEKTALTVCEF